MDEVNKTSTMSSVKEYPRKRRIFTKKYYTEELKDAGALKIKTVNGVEQMALKKVSDLTVGLVVAAKGTKSFPDSVIVKWIRPGSKLTQLMEQQFLMYDLLVKFLGGGVHQDDIEKWKNLLRTNKYTWPEENDGWSSIFGNETFLSFKIIPVKLLAKGFGSKEKDAGISSDVKPMPLPEKSLEHFIKQAENVSKSDNQNEDELISKQSHRSEAKQSHRSEAKQSHRSEAKQSHRNEEKQSHHSDSKQSQHSDSKQSHPSESKEFYHSDNDIENQAIPSHIVKKKHEVAKNNISKIDTCKLDKETLLDVQKEYSEEILEKSVNDTEEASNSGNNIFRDSKENCLQRLSIEYTDLVEADSAKEGNKINISENCCENNEKSLNVFEDQDGIGKGEENISKRLYSDREEESLAIQYEETSIEENMVEKLPIDKYKEYSKKMDINDINLDKERKILIQDLPTGKIENMETESATTSKPLSEIIIKKKRKKRVIQDDDISDMNYKSYRVVILPEEDLQCSFCERITHTVDNCPDRKRLKTLQNRTVWDRISVKKRTSDGGHSLVLGRNALKLIKKNTDESRITNCLNVQNMKSTFSVLKCATGSKYLYKTKVEKPTDTLTSSNKIDFYAKSQIKINPNTVKPFISNKWHKPSTNTVSMKCDVDKKKKELLSKQIKELKQLLNLFTNKKSDMSLEVKKALLETIKSLQTSIDNIRQQLNNNLNKKQSTNVDNDTLAFKDKKVEKEYNTKVQHMENESDKGIISPTPKRLHEDSSMEVKQLQIDSEKDEYEELKNNVMLNLSSRQQIKDIYLPNLLPSPGRLLDKSNLKVQHLENELEKEKCEELKYDMLSPSSRQKSEDEYSLHLLLSPESLVDKSPTKNMNNNDNAVE